jgi:hypothetical protein
MVLAGYEMLFNQWDLTLRALVAFGKTGIIGTLFHKSSFKKNL